jgi:cell division protein FtsW (lipid II flippase)
MKIIEKITDVINPNLGMSICVLLTTIIVFFNTNFATWKYGFWISIVLIGIISITFFFSIRHSWKLRKKAK